MRVLGKHACNHYDHKRERDSGRHAVHYDGRDAGRRTYHRLLYVFERPSYGGFLDKFMYDFATVRPRY